MRRCKVIKPLNHCVSYYVKPENTVALIHLTMMSWRVLNHLLFAACQANLKLTVLYWVRWLKLLNLIAH